MVKAKESRLSVNAKGELRIKVGDNLSAEVYGTKSVKWVNGVEYMGFTAHSFSSAEDEQPLPLDTLEEQEEETEDETFIDEPKEEQAMKFVTASMVVGAAVLLAYFAYVIWEEIGNYFAV